jgi:K+ transporter
LAFLSIVIGAVMIVLLYQVTMLTLLMRDEIKPLLESINETMNTVRGTAVFMSDNLVQPTIGVASAMSGVKRVFDSLTGIRSAVNPKQRKE